MSVITATSATALAIPYLVGGNTFWMISTCFSIAFGLSLEGLLLVTYMTVLAAGASHKLVYKLAGYQHPTSTTDQGPASIARQNTSTTKIALVFHITALVMCLPTVFSIYSSLFLLAGVLMMVTQGRMGGGVEQHQIAFSVVAWIPLGLGVIVLCFVVVYLELAAARDTGDPADM
jgi:hypothetical protein